MNESQETRLALEIAEALNDKQSLSMHQSFVRTVPEDKLREILAKVMSIPIEKIKNTRGALFNYLVQQYVNHSRY